MKIITCFIAIFFSISVTAQNDNSNLLKPLLIKPGNSYQPLGKAKLISSSANGKVYALPLDNMPCLAPNSNGIAKIPNGSKYPIISGMGNPFKKEEIGPKKNEKNLAFNNSLLLKQLHKKNLTNNFILSR